MSLLKETKSDRTEKVMELLQSPQDLNAKDNKTGNTPVHFSIENQNETILNALLSMGSKPNLNAVNNDGLTPLSYAAMLNFTEGIEILLKHGADANFAPAGERTALQHAAMNNLKEGSKLLLKHNANINQTSEEGTALHLATKGGNDDVAFLLMENLNIDLLKTDEEGNTFLHTAVQTGAYNIFQKFFTDLEAGSITNVDVTKLLNKANNAGNTLLHEAEIGKKTSISQFLKENAEKYNIELNLKNNDGFTPDECKKQHVIKAQQDEEKKKLRKEEAKEMKKIRKEEQDKYTEELRVQEKAQKKRELEEQQKLQKAYDASKKMTPVIGVGILIAVFIVVYFLLDYGIKRKKDTTMDL